jgi:hypothetical protein
MMMPVVMELALHGQSVVHYHPGSQRSRISPDFSAFWAPPLGTRFASVSKV